MPKIEKVFTLEITPEQFLNSCSSNELQEIVLLINSNYFQNKIADKTNFIESGDNSNVDYREVLYEKSISDFSLSVRLLNRLVAFFYDQNINSRNWKVKNLVNFDLLEFSKLRGNGTGATYNELKRFLDDNKIPYKN